MFYLRCAPELTSTTITTMMVNFRFFIHMAWARLRLVVLKVTDCTHKSNNHQHTSQKVTQTKFKTELTESTRFSVLSMSSSSLSPLWATRSTATQTQTAHVHSEVTARIYNHWTKSLTDVPDHNAFQVVHVHLCFCHSVRAFGIRVVFLVITAKHMCLMTYPPSDNIMKTQCLTDSWVSGCRALSALKLLLGDCQYCTFTVNHCWTVGS